MTLIMHQTGTSHARAPVAIVEFVHGAQVGVGFRGSDGLSAGRPRAGAAGIACPNKDRSEQYDLRVLR